MLAVHSATDACHGWPAYGDLVGARFDGHPWTQPFQVEVADRDHPSTAHLDATWAWRDARCTCSVPSGRTPGCSCAWRRTSSTCRPPARGVPDCGFPLAWSVADPGGSRSFYTALGHFPSVWETPAYLRHLAGGLSWLLAPDPAG